MACAIAILGYFLHVGFESAKCERDDSGTRMFWTAHINVVREIRFMIPHIPFCLGNQYELVDRSAQTLPCFGHQMSQPHVATADQQAAQQRSATQAYILHNSRTIRLRAHMICGLGNGDAIPICSRQRRGALATNMQLNLAADILRLCTEGLTMRKSGHNFQWHATGVVNDRL